MESWKKPRMYLCFVPILAGRILVPGVRYMICCCKDEDKNSVTGSNVFIYNSQNCLINLPDNKLAVIQGLEDYIVVESDNILLICRKQDEQKIKNFVNDVQVGEGRGIIFKNDKDHV